jgi:hypothetical protein
MSKLLRLNPSSSDTLTQLVHGIFSSQFQMLALSHNFIKLETIFFLEKNWYWTVMNRNRFDDNSQSFILIGPLVENKSSSLNISLSSVFMMQQMWEPFQEKRCSQLNLHAFGWEVYHNLCALRICFVQDAW